MQAALDALLYGISIYALPAVIALVTLLALLVWDQKYPATGATGLELKSIEEISARLKPAESLAQIEREAAAQLAAMLVDCGGAARDVAARHQQHQHVVDAVPVHALRGG